MRQAAMRIALPNSAHLQNLAGFIRKYDPDRGHNLNVDFHKRWIHVHPAALAMVACAGAIATQSGIQTRGRVPKIGAARYLIRMGLFNYLNLAPPFEIEEYAEEGRFIPLTQICTTADLGGALNNLIPLLHAPPAVADPIQYVFSEMVRNVLEHSESPVGALVCAQYYKSKERLSIGIADAGVGIRKSITRSHKASTSAEAIELALRPGVTGGTSRLGGNEFNAGAGLFFTKSIASLSQNFFALYSGDALYKLLRSPTPSVHADPMQDRHNITTGLPFWNGTVVGININVNQTRQFSDLLSTIRKAYDIDVNREKKKKYYKKIKFI